MNQRNLDPGDSKNELPISSSSAYDVSGWHDNPKCDVDCIPVARGSGIALYCRTCKVIGEVEAVATRISHAASSRSMVTP